MCIIIHIFFWGGGQRGGKCGAISPPPWSHVCCTVKALPHYGSQRFPLNQPAVRNPPGRPQLVVLLLLFHLESLQVTVADVGVRQRWKGATVVAWSRTSHPGGSDRCDNSQRSSQPKTGPDVFPLSSDAEQNPMVSVERPWTLCVGSQPPVKQKGLRRVTEPENPQTEHYLPAVWLMPRTTCCPPNVVYDKSLFQPVGVHHQDTCGTCGSSPAPLPFLSTLNITLFSFERKRNDGAPCCLSRGVTGGGPSVLKKKPKNNKTVPVRTLIELACSCRTTFWHCATSETVGISWLLFSNWNRVSQPSSLGSVQTEQTGVFPQRIGPDLSLGLCNLLMDLKWPCFHVSVGA